MLIYQALGFPTPIFGHVSLILAPDKSKLSKRHGATSVGEFREEGYLAAVSARACATGATRRAWGRDTPFLRAVRVVQGSVRRAGRHWRWGRQPWRDGCGSEG